MVKLDDRDLKILTVLQTEGRIAKTDLARKVNLSPTACWERLKRLEQSGIIEGYGVHLSLSKLGAPSTIITQVEISSHRAEDFESFEQAIMEIPEIVECWAVGGGIDYFLKFVCQGIDTYQRLIDQMLQSEIGLRRYYTYVVTKPVKSQAFPPLSVLIKPDEVEF